MHGKHQIITALALAAAVCSLSGCRRSELNYEIAECIGTLGEYENNEPVETPKMKAEREAKESEEALEAERVETLDRAAAMAQTYCYEDAISLLQNSEILQDDERSTEAIEQYQKLQDSMYEYEGDIGHLCFTNLVVDTERAFDGDDYSSIYRSNMITLEEFQNILNTLYESGYVLIDIHSLTEETQDEDGNLQLTESRPVLPNGKKPLILSVENLNYSSVRSGDGVATRLALDADGNVGAVYTDAEGHESIGAYDVIPVVEAFLEEHPDFSFQGARGIVGLSGANGAFGYSVSEDSTVNYEKNQEMVRQIADVLREDGWSFASEGYNYQYMGDMSYDTLRNDITKWESEIGSLIGDCDILFYPYGSEVDYSSEKAALLINQGFRYFEGMWSDGDHLEVNATYLRQTRRTVTGYILENYPGNMSTYFSVSSILDAAR